MTRLVHDHLDQRFVYNDWLWRRVRDDALARDEYRCQAQGEHKGKLGRLRRRPRRLGRTPPDPTATRRLASFEGQRSDELEARSSTSRTHAVDRPRTPQPRHALPGAAMFAVLAQTFRTDDETDEQSGEGG